jgi:hypothetical protein
VHWWCRRGQLLEARAKATKICPGLTLLRALKSEAPLGGPRRVKSNYPELTWALTPTVLLHEEQTENKDAIWWFYGPSDPRAQISIQGINDDLFIHWRQMTSTQRF